MSSDAWLAREWLGRILLLIAPRRLERLIDEPVDAVTEDFCAALQPVTTHDEIVAVIACFVQRLHKEALPVKGTMPSCEAIAEGIALLGGGQRDGATGYDQAVLSVLSSGDAEEVVLQMGAVAKAREREAIVRWTIEDAIAQCTWDVRCRLVAGIVETEGKCLPTDVRNLPPAQLAPFLRDLVWTVYQANGKVENARPKSILGDDTSGATPVWFLLPSEEVGVEAMTDEAGEFDRAEA